MKVFVIGGTGLVGSYLLPRLIENSHEVYALTRNESKIEKIKQLVGYALVGDIRNPETFQDHLPEKLERIVLLAMPDVKPGHRITKKRMKTLRSDTNVFFRNAMDLAIRYDIPIILPSGTSFRTGENEVADETWPILREGLTEIGKDTDIMVSEAIQTGNPRVIQLLFGKIYGNGGLFRFMYQMMEKGRTRIIGKGDNCIPNLHAADAASAIMMAMEQLPVGEKFIIADDTAVSQRDFICYMAELMGQKTPGHIPAWLIRLILGRDLYAVISMHCKVSNAKAKKMMGWKPEYPSYREGLAAVIKEIKTGNNCVGG